MADDAESRRQLRRRVDIAGNYRAIARGGGARDIWIKDISQTGCRFFDRFCVLELGSEISFRIGQIGPIAATVRWREKDTVGIEFAHPLHASVLDHIVAHLDRAD